MVWLNGLILILAAVGNTFLWVAYVNRTHAMRMKCENLHVLRRLHDFMIPAFPVLLFIFVGVTGPRLLLGGGWEEVSAFWLCVLAVCAAGFLGFVFNVLRWQSRANPDVQTSNDSEVYDVAKLLGRLPVADGKYDRLAKIPGNDQMRLELNTKRFAFSGLPRDLDGLSILHFSDVHFFGTIERSYFEKVIELAGAEPVDMVCFTGDLIDDMACLEWLPTTLGKLNGRFGNYFILGNHDWNQDELTIRNSMKDLGWQDVASRTVTVDLNGTALEIGGDETPWMGVRPVFSESADFRLLMSHTPDHFAQAQKQEVNLMLSGHNHGGQIRLPVIGPVYSPSWYGVKYASGTFHREKTTLHVSRGVSGRHPLRWNCLPEVTRIILTCSEV